MSIQFYCHKYCMCCVSCFPPSIIYRAYLCQPWHTHFVKYRMFLLFGAFISTNMDISQCTALSSHENQSVSFHRPKSLPSWFLHHSSCEFREGSKYAAAREMGALDFNQKTKLSIIAKQRLAQYHFISIILF